MSTKNQNFEMYAGDTKNIVVKVKETTLINSIITVKEIDLTGATIKWAMKKKVTDATNDVFKNSSNGGIVISDPTNGEFTILLSPLDTINLMDDYYHEAEVTDRFGNVSTVMTGRVTILPSGV